MTGLQVLEHLSDALGSQVGPSLGGVDPSQVAPPVELGKGVEERCRVRVGVQRSRDVVRQVLALWTFGLDDDSDGVARSEATVTKPSRSKGEPIPLASRLDDAANPHVRDRAVDVVSRLCAPHRIRVERYGDDDPSPTGGRDGSGELLRRHSGSSNDDQVTVGVAKDSMGTLASEERLGFVHTTSPVRDIIARWR